MQQIKFECLAYIKEYGGDPRAWLTLACAGPGEAGLARWGVDPAHDIWMCKPALSPLAAMSVVHFLRERMGVGVPPEPRGAAPDDRFVLLFRPGERPKAAGQE